MPGPRRIEWSPAAERDVQEAIDFLWPSSEAAVQRLGERIDEATARLTRFPDLGSRLDIPTLPDSARSLLVDGYAIAYLPSDDLILVLRVWAPKKDRPPRSDQ